MSKKLKSFRGGKIPRIEYFEGITSHLIYEAQKPLISAFMGERELMAWNCCGCTGKITINIMHFDKLKETDFLCDECKKYPVNKAIQLQITKSSHHLFQILQNKMYANYGKTSILK